MKPVRGMDHGTANDAVLKDLIGKAQADISTVMARLRSISPEPFIVVAMGAGVGAIVPIAVELHHMTGLPYTDKPDPDCMLLAALLLARSGIDGADAIEAAYADFDALKAAGRFAPPPGDGYGG